MSTPAKITVYEMVRIQLADLGELVSLDADRLWHTFDCHYARYRAEGTQDDATAYAAMVGLSCLRISEALTEPIAADVPSRDALHPFLGALAAMSEWCFATGIDIDGTVRPFVAGYFDMLIACGQPIADEHAQHVAFDYAARVMFATGGYDAEGVR